jgi:LAO/AO transport system kinase
MGDEVQAIKAGLLEVADIVVVNKGDRPGAQRAAAQLRAMLTVGARHDRAAALAGRPQPKRPDVLLATALTGDGVPELLAALDRRAAARAAGSDEGQAEATRLARARAQVEGILGERVRARLARAAPAREMEALVEAVARHVLDPYAAADRALDLLAGPGSVG